MNRPSLLIVDDEPNVLLTLQLVFSDSGYAVTVANSAKEAIQEIDSRKFDAILTDLSMEHDQSGFEVVQVAASLQPRPVVIVLTGFATIENARSAIGTAVDHFALKPIDLEIFKHVLHRLIALRNDRLVAH